MDLQNYHLTELARRLENLVRIGTVRSVDLDAPSCRVQYATDDQGRPVLTGWLPWTAPRAGDDRDWRPPSIGEQVLMLSPSGELANGVVLQALYQTAHPAPSADAGKRATLYRDGALVEYDAEAHRLKAMLPAGGRAELTAPGGVTSRATSRSRATWMSPVGSMPAKTSSRPRKWKTRMAPCRKCEIFTTNTLTRRAG